MVVIQATNAEEVENEAPSPATTKASGQDFSYSEKDLLPDLSKHVQAQLRQLVLLDSASDYLEVCAVKAFGQAFESHRNLPCGSVKRSTIISIKLEVKWYGR